VRGRKRCCYKRGVGTGTGVKSQSICLIVRRVGTVLSGLLTLAMISGQPAFSLHQQSDGGHFDEFYAKFKTAVANQDKQRLEPMMTSNFEFLRAADVTPANVFRALDQNNEQQWRNLQLAVQRGAPVAQNYGSHPARLLWCTPSQVIYNCHVVFEKDSSGRWKWKGFVMPEQ
jgi:hypothetical protein